MTIYQLMVYSCLAVIDLHGDLVTKTCTWQPRQMFAQQVRCDEAGRASIGERIFRDSIQMGADPEKVERARCVPLSVVSDPT